MTASNASLIKAIREVGAAIVQGLEYLEGSVQDVTATLRAQSAVLMLDPDALAEASARIEEAADEDAEARALHHFHGLTRHDPRELLDTIPEETE